MTFGPLIFLKSLKLQQVCGEPAKNEFNGEKNCTQIRLKIN
jgi:hypothetical protein